MARKKITVANTEQLALAELTIEQRQTEGLSLTAAISIAASALSGPDRTIPSDELEVAVLARSNGRRTFLRITDSEVAAAL